MLNKWYLFIIITTTVLVESTREFIKIQNDEKMIQHFVCTVY